MGSRMVDDLLDWVEENFNVIGGRAVAELPSAVRTELGKAFPSSTVHSIAEARQAGAVLWTDDYLVASYSEFRLKLPFVHTQQVFADEVRAGGLAVATYERASEYLLRQGFESTLLQPSIFINFSQSLNWDAGKMSKALRCIAATPMGVAQFASAVCQIACEACRQIVSRDVRVNYLSAVFSHILLRQERELIVREMIEIAPRICGLNVVAEGQITNMLRQIQRNI